MSTVPAPISTASTVNALPPHLGRPGNAAVRWTLTTIAVLFLSAFIVLPVTNVFRNALGLQWSDFKPTVLPSKLGDGLIKYKRTFYVAPLDPQTLPRPERRQYLRDAEMAQKNRDAIRMTASTLLIVVPMNVVFGLAASWAITKFRFRGKTLLVSLIDLPFSVSPVVAGLIFVLLFGRVGIFGDYIATHFHWPWPTSAFWRGPDGEWIPFFLHWGWWFPPAPNSPPTYLFKVGFSDWRQGVIFTPLATTLASAFVTFPFVARALIPLMESQGTEAEQAAITLGASGWQTYRRVTLPAIKWGLLYGIILCSARAVGEFGAVSVVSGGVPENDTMPLRVEKIWQGYNQQQAFALASLLAGVSIVTLLLKVFTDRKQGQEAKKPRAGH